MLIALPIAAVILTFLAASYANKHSGTSGRVGVILFVVLTAVIVPMVAAATDDFDAPFAVEGAILIALLVFVPSILTAIAAAIFIKSPEDR